MKGAKTKGVSFAQSKGKNPHNPWKKQIFLDKSHPINFTYSILLVPPKINQKIYANKFYLSFAK